MEDASQLAEIAKRLRHLQATSPTTSDGLDAWYAAARQFTEWKCSVAPEVQLPPSVMFYLHDADTRLKDSGILDAQTQALAAVISSLERGVVPASSGVSLAFHPRWLGVAVLVILALVLYWLAR